MPYVKSIPIRTTVARSIAYILNPNKTDDLLFTTSLNCITNPKDAYLNMKLVYEQFSGKRFDEPLPLVGKGRVKAIHYIQSFDPKDNITPELAHRIAKAFARKTFGDNCQIVIATHVDKSHIHNHFIINTYGIDGHKFNDNQATLNHVKEYSDRVCLAFGIKPYDKSKGKGKTIVYNEWEHKRKGTSWKQKIRLEIDRFIATSKNIDELIYELELRGYTIRRGKYISVKAPEQQRAVRLNTLGVDYTSESIASRILWRDVGTDVTLTGKPSQIRADYNNAIAQVSQLAREGRKVQRRRDMTSPYSPENDMDIYKLSAQLTIINRDNIHYIGELEGKIEWLKAEFDKKVRACNEASTKLTQLETVISQAEEYFELKGKSELSASEKVKLQIYLQTMEHCKIQNRTDIESVREMCKNISERSAALNTELEKCREKYNTYSDIVKTYRELSSGDYISRLVKEEEKRRENEQRKKTTRR